MPQLNCRNGLGGLVDKRNGKVQRLSAERLLEAVPQQPSRTSQVLDRLTTAIRTGKLPPGERLVELQIAAQLGVSRAPLREALRKLEAEGLVQTTKGRGTFVIEPSKSEVEQMVVMRAVLEGLAARLVAANATADERRELRELHEQMQSAAEAHDEALWRETDWHFHERLCATAGNRFLLDTWRALSNVMRIYQRGRPINGSPSELMQRHDAFIRALESQDAARAEIVFRDILLRSGFEAIGKIVPAALADDQRVISQRKL
jgi:DNA-binding GntR family transcriptional regulator